MSFSPESFIGPILQTCTCAAPVAKIIIMFSSIYPSCFAKSHLTILPPSEVCLHNLSRLSKCLNSLVMLSCYKSPTVEYLSTTGVLYLDVFFCIRSTHTVLFVLSHFAGHLKLHLMLPVPDNWGRFFLYLLYVACVFFSCSAFSSQVQCNFTSAINSSSLLTSLLFHPSCHIQELITCSPLHIPPLNLALQTMPD